MTNKYFICSQCKVPVIVGGLIGKAGKAKVYCMRHYREKHQETRAEIADQTALSGAVVRNKGR